MIEILPAILAKNEEEFVAKVDRVRPLGATLHIDMMDGVFVNNSTWAPPDRVRQILEDVPFEAHLMVSNPEHAVPIWLAEGATRVIFHAEATSKESLICRATADECGKLAIAINPETPVSRLTSVLQLFTQVLVMGVTPGWSGQPFQPIAIEKVRALRALKPSLRIGVDGGVNPDTARLLAAAGADGLVAGSALTEHLDPAEAFMILKEAVGNSGRIA